ncbi:trehalose 6-phosphate synthase [Carboxydocella thermautotrophica]|nr:trehalose 6-phosphate synthase [Carboxydocella thermautotrophica]
MAQLSFSGGKTGGRLLVVSNRGACTLRQTPGGLAIIPAVSGLVSAVEPILRREGGIWVAWGGRCGQEPGHLLPLPEGESKYLFAEVVLSSEEIKGFYDGFSNSIMWPLCHGFLEKVQFEENYWQLYRQVNEKFARTVVKMSSHNDRVWVHDYHLTLLPALIRRQRPVLSISFFWHVPFPPVELFATLPWAGEILRGLLACDQIGFHTESYVRNFLQAVEEILRARVDYLNSTIHWGGRKIRVIAAPIGIDWREYLTLAAREEIKGKAEQIRLALQSDYVLLGVDRLDYTKGIPQRLQAFSHLLTNYPWLRGKVALLQVVVPSRVETAAYQSLRQEIEKLVGEINGLFTTDYQVPVRYLYRSLTRQELVAHYLAADLALVTPLRDGLNLVAKEYVASKARGTGGLLLSPFAGAALQLKGALLANPYHPREMAEQIKRGLEMPLPEQQQRLSSMMRIIREQDLEWWWQQVKGMSNNAEQPEVAAND